VDRYAPPEEFEHLRELGEAMGFTHVASAPLVRSSYHADTQARGAGIA
jgi:lipoic acid synthetase